MLLLCLTLRTSFGEQTFRPISHQLPIGIKEQPANTVSGLQVGLCKELSVVDTNLLNQRL